ncbi:MAG: hypothetical protein PWP48_2118 [Clostridiales bacterium]|nr:hypothetical protein [Clostridiales bacterium]
MIIDRLSVMLYHITNTIYKYDEEEEYIKLSSQREDALAGSTLEREGWKTAFGVA